MVKSQQADNIVNYGGQQLELEILYGWSTHLHAYTGVRSFELGNEVKKLLP